MKFISCMVAMLFSLLIHQVSAQIDKPINQIQVIGSHNSYKEAIDPALLKAMKASNPTAVSGLEYEHISMPGQLDMGLRNLEIDVYADEKGGRYAHPKSLEQVKGQAAFDPKGEMKQPGFKVLHVPDLDFRSSVLTFKSALQQLKKWSEANPDHTPVFITLEAKDSPTETMDLTQPEVFTGKTFDELDAVILENLGAKHLITPDQVRGQYNTLEEAVLNQNWPKLSEAKGKFIFVLDATGKKRATYIEGHFSLKGRIMFANADEGSPEAALMIRNNPNDDQIPLLVKKGYIIRTRADSETIQARNNDWSGFEAASKSGAQIITTDYYLKSKLFASRYSVSFEGGRYVRNNPLFVEQMSFTQVLAKDDGFWLKGDLHVHSRHSKESSNHPISKILNFSKSVGMDYLAITDHDNHVDGDVEHHTWADPEFKSDSLLLLYGAEWTTKRGHGNTFSAKPYNHQSLYDIRDERDINVGKVKDSLDIHLSANHPIGKDNFGFSYDLVESIEVWNSAIWPKNANAIMIWDDMLSTGRMIAGRGGSDAHHGVPVGSEKPSANTFEAEYNYIGTPTTWVYAKERSAQAVVDALTQGRVSISSNPFAPRVEFYADAEQDGEFEMMMGDNAISKGKPVKFQVQLVGNTLKDESYTVKVIKNANVLSTYHIKGELPAIEFTDTPDSQERTYYRIVVEGAVTSYPDVPKSMALTENMVGRSNPIFFNFDPEF